MRLVIGLLAILEAVALVTLAQAAREVPLLEGGSLEGWEEQTFEKVKPTSFAPEHDDELGRSVLAIRADASSSGWNLERPIDLGETPYLKVRWRVGEVAEPAGDPSTKVGDDYPLRIYLHKAGVTRLTLRSLQLVLSPVHERGQHWTSPYSSLAWSIVAYSLADADDLAGEGWSESVVEVPRAWREARGEEPPDVLDGISILADTDGSRAVSSVYVDGIWLLAEPGAAGG